MVGLIAFANDGGLGIQTKRLYEMLKPDKVLLIDSRPFSKNKKMHWDWYPKNITTVTSDGFPKNWEIHRWVEGLTTVLTVENPYNFYLIWLCRQLNIKTIVQTNYEFNENIYAPWLPIPDLFLMPSYWYLVEMKRKFGNDKVLYMPPPIDPKEFNDVFFSNVIRCSPFAKNNKAQFLHIVGTLAFEDRNGTLDLLKAIRKCKSDFDLTIHSQHPIPKNYITGDPRVTYRIKNFKKNSDLYKGFDYLLLPRRYGGLSLTTNEALMCGMPVMMTDISPNNELLPKEWLVPAKKQKSITVRVKLDCYSAYINSFAKKIDEWAKIRPDTFRARKIGFDNFSSEKLVKKYRSVIN